MPECALQLPLGQWVAEVNDAGNQAAAAGTDPQLSGFIYLSLAPLTSQLRHITVQLGEQLRLDARFQVKIVDILGNSVGWNFP
jgi:hypothetical protein